MFSWGEDSSHGFGLRTKDGSKINIKNNIHFLDLRSKLQSLSAGHRVAAFVRQDGKVSAIRMTENRDGHRIAGKLKSVRCKERIRTVSCGDEQVTLLSEDGNVLFMDTGYTPRPLEIPCNRQVFEVACGHRHSLAITQDSCVYAWGDNSNGQLGLGNNEPGSSSPRRIESLSRLPLAQITAGGDHSFVWLNGQTVIGWGRNTSGQLGLGDTTDRNVPTQVLFIDMKKTVFIACGKDHTAILTKDGTVFTFGCGQYGQLGHNSLMDELKPRVVEELLGTDVTQIACGRHHTLVFSGSSKNIFSFGNGEQGQLGNGANMNQSMPLRVQLTMTDGNADQEIGKVYAGGNNSFTMTTFAQELKMELNDISDRQTSSKHSGLNLSLARLAFKKIANKKKWLDEVRVAVLDSLLPHLNECPAGLEELRVFILLTELLSVLGKRLPDVELTCAIAAAILRLHPEKLQVLGDWWSTMKPTSKVDHVQVWKQALSFILTTDPLNARNTGVKDLLKMLQHLYKVNHKTNESHRITESAFCVEEITHHLLEDIMLWFTWANKQDVEMMPVIFCRYPFVMNLKCKIGIFEMNALLTKVQHQAPRRSWMRFFMWTPQPSTPNFELRLKRASLAKDTFTQLASADHGSFKKPLRVYFDEDSEPTLVYRRDFFLHLFKELMSLDSEMFMYNDAKTLAWFPSQPKLAEDRYFQLGVLCGLALYNQNIVNLSFPLALFKKLLNIEVTLEDLRDFSPVLGESLRYILDDYTYEDIENLDMVFSVIWDGIEVELDPHNPGKMVTNENKKEFVDLYVKYIFNKSVERVFEKFQQGFFKVCDQHVVQLFQPEELRGLMVGKENYDWGKLKQNTSYEGIYHVSHPNIVTFWKVFDELTEDQKKAFLLFLTGCDRVPILGMDHIRMRVRDLYNSSQQHFPEAHTCFSILELPLYSSKDTLQARLTEAISNNRGFSQE
ncbi:putative E3 ubiquitin-protein ligase HERC3 [Aplochiton taeniatus]